MTVQIKAIHAIHYKKKFKGSGTIFGVDAKSAESLIESGAARKATEEELKSIKEDSKPKAKTPPKTNKPKNNTNTTTIAPKPIEPNNDNPNGNQNDDPNNNGGDENLENGNKE